LPDVEGVMEIGIRAIAVGSPACSEDVFRNMSYASSSTFGRVHSSSTVVDADT
jgi:hypothetical protein